MLNITAFSNELLSKLDNSGDILTSSKAHRVWAEAIGNYLESNLQISGTYIGICGGGSPDPLNGVHVWKPSSVSIDYVSLVNGARSGGLDGWTNNLSSAVNAGVVFNGKSEDGLILCSSNCHPSITVFIEHSDFEGGYGLDGLNARNYMINIVISVFVNALRHSSLTPNPATGTGSCSTGTITWSTLE